MIAKGYFQTPEIIVDYMVEKLFEGRWPSKNTRVLDAGCGPGDFIDGILRWCSKNNAEIPKITGIELDSKHYKIAQKKYMLFPQINIQNRDFLLIEHVDYDYIIGNPPYVQITNLNDEEKNLYKPIFKTAVERFDLYMLFFEKSLSLLKINGRLVFITPEKYIYVNTAKPLRKILSSYYIKEIEHLREDVFQGLTTYPTITTIENIESRKKTLIKHRNKDETLVRLLKDGSSWLPIINGNEKTNSKYVLKDICDRISCGIATGADNIFVQKTEQFSAELLPYSYYAISGKELKYGEAIPAPVNSILVPYDYKGKLISFDELGPVKSFLLKEDVIERLKKRSCARRKPWYAFHENPPMKYLLKPKILCKDISAQAEFWLDSDGLFFPRHTIYYIVPKNQEILEKLFTYLNSDEVKVWLEQHCQRASNGFFRLQSTILKKLPIPEELYLSSVSNKMMSPNYEPAVFSDAVRQYWEIRLSQGTAQEQRGVSDTGTRSQVTGGQQMNGFSDKLIELLLEVGVSLSDIYVRNKKDLPGFYRPHKGWDFIVMSKGKLIAAIEFKSQIGPSFGNNFNNRTEEAVGSAEDFWTAYREGAFGTSPQPWLGYLFMLEDCPATHKIRNVRQPHFKVLKEFNKTSYAKRYELLCRKLILERKYNSACLILSDSERHQEPNNYTEPSSDLSADQFIKQLLNHVRTHV